MKPDFLQVLKICISILIIFILETPVSADENEVNVSQDNPIEDQSLTKTEKIILMLKGEVPIQHPSEKESSIQENILQVPMTLDQLTHLALKQNPGLQAVRMEKDISDQTILASRGEKFGRINFDVTDFTHGHNNLPLLAKSVAIDQIKTNQSGVRDFNNNIFSFGGTVTLPIYTGGRITNQIKLAKLGKELANSRVLQTKDELIFNVTSVYYNILKYQDFIQAAKQSVKQLSESKRVVLQRFKEGKVAKIDTLKINTRLAEVEQLLIEFLNAQEVLYGLLGVLLGEEAGISKRTISGNLEMSSEELKKNYSLIQKSSFSNVQKLAIKSRPELQAIRKELEIQEKRIRIRFAEHLPSINLKGQLQGVQGDNSSLFAQQFAGIFMSVPLFSGGSIEAKVQRERVRYSKLYREFAQLKLSVIQEVHAAHLNTREAIERIMSAQAAVDEANEVLRIEALKVREGKSIIENLLDAQTAQLRSEQNFSAAVADYQIQLMALKKAIGTIEVEG